jgi:hypothetical protein
MLADTSTHKLGSNGCRTGKWAYPNSRPEPAMEIQASTGRNGDWHDETSAPTKWLGAFRDPSLTFGALIGAANVSGLPLTHVSQRS